MNAKNHAGGLPGELRRIDEAEKKKMEMSESEAEERVRIMMERISLNNSYLSALNSVSSILLESDTDEFEDSLYHSMGLLTRAVDADRMRVWKNHTVDGELYYEHLYAWTEKGTPQNGQNVKISASYGKTLPEWEEVLSRGDAINILLRDMSQAEQALLFRRGIISALVVPIFLHGEFWGFVSVDDCRKERNFSKDEETTLRSAGNIIASALIRNNTTRAMIEYHQNLQGMLDSLPVGIRIINRDDGKLVYANEALMDIFDCKDFERDVAGRSDFDFMPDTQPNGRKTVDMANDFFQTEKVPMHFQCFKLSGELFTARVTSCNIPFKGKQSSLAIIEDVTKERESIAILTNVLNEIDVMIYVTDPNTDEILFMNEYMKQHYNIEHDCVGQTCYKVLQRGLDRRCDFCPCLQIEKEPDKSVIWEERSTLTNRIYRNIDRFIDWPDGKKVHLQQSVDITELAAAKELAEKGSARKAAFSPK